MTSSGSYGSGSSSSKGGWFEVVGIVEEDGRRYKVQWAGKDPKTGKPWPLDWVPKSHCSPELIKDWEKKKGAVFLQLRYSDAFICGNNTAKKQEPLSSASVSTSMRSPVALKRPSEKRHAANTSGPPVRPTRKRKHPTPHGSPGNTDEDSAPPRRKRLAAAAAESTPGSGRGLSTESAHALPNREDRQASPSHPPLEEIAMWVPTPNAKFGPPKRKRTIGERRDPPKERPVDIADSAKPPLQASIPLPSSPRPLILSESQIVALREEEESQSQSQTTSNQPGGPVEDSTTSDPLQPTVDSNGATEVPKGHPLGSLEGPIGRPSVDIQLPSPNVNNGHVSGPNSQGIHLQPNVADISMQGEGVTEAPKGSSPLPAAPHISLVNLNPSARAISSSKSPQVEMPAKSGPPQVELPMKSGPPQVEMPMKSGPPQVELPTKSGPPQIGNPGTSSAEQRSFSKSEPRRSGNGTLAERRAFEARVRLDELRRAGATFGKGHMASNTSQSFKQPPPHVVFKKYKDVMESPSQSQVTHLGNSGNEILGSVSPSQNRRTDFSDEPEVVDLVLNKSGQDANVDSLPQKDDVVAANVLAVRGDWRPRLPQC